MFKINKIEIVNTYDVGDSPQLLLFLQSIAKFICSDKPAEQSITKNGEQL